MVAVPAPAADHRPDVAVDGFHLAERDLDVAVREDAVEVATEQLGDLVEGREPLPAQGANPRRQEPPRRAFVDVVPEVFPRTRIRLRKCRQLGTPYLVEQCVSFGTALAATRSRCQPNSERPKEPGCHLSRKLTALHPPGVGPIPLRGNPG